MINIFWSLKQVVIKYPLYENVNEKKLIKSIQRLETDNEYIKYEDKVGGIGTNKTLSFIIQNNTLILSWSHLYYDMYSITFVLSKIDDIYNNKIKTFKFKYYQHSLHQFISEDVGNFKKIITRIGNDIFNVRHFDKKKYIKIPKSELISYPSTSEIFKYILNELNIDEYCLTVNLRNIHPEYVEHLGNLSCTLGTIHKNDNLQKYLKKLSIKPLEENLLNKCLVKTSINSLLNMNVASFIDKTKIIKDIRSIKYYKETITILPKDTDKKYIIAVYLH